MNHSESPEKAELEKLNTLIRHQTTVPKSVKNLLVNTVIGTRGAQYRLLNTSEHLYQLVHPHFYFIERNEKAIVNITICERDVAINNQITNAFYIRYVAIQKIFQGGEKASSHNNPLHQYFKILFNSLNLKESTKEPNQKSLFWAYIDPENLRSFKMKERFGFEEIGEFRTTIFQRFFPKKNKSVRNAHETDFKIITKQVGLFFKEYNFYSTIRLNQKDYFVLVENNEIIAGCKCYLADWEILQLPGKNGKLIQRILPFIPFSKRLIHPSKNEFIACEGLWWRTGCENRVSDFLEGVLSINKKNALFIWEDTQTNRIKDLKMNCGMMEKLKQDNAIKIVAKFNNYSASEIDKIKSRPKFLSGFDMT